MYLFFKEIQQKTFKTYILRTSAFASWPPPCLQTTAFGNPFLPKAVLHGCTLTLIWSKSLTFSVV